MAGSRSWLRGRIPVAAGGPLGGPCPILGARRERRLAGMRGQTRSDAAIVPVSMPLTCWNVVELWFRRLERSVVVLDVTDSKPIALLKKFP